MPRSVEAATADVMTIGPLIGELEAAPSAAYERTGRVRAADAGTIR